MRVKVSKRKRDATRRMQENAKVPQERGAGTRRAHVSTKVLNKPGRAFSQDLSLTRRPISRQSDTQETEEADVKVFQGKDASECTLFL